MHAPISQKGGKTRRSNQSRLSCVSNANQLTETIEEEITSHSRRHRGGCEMRGCFVSGGGERPLRGLATMSVQVTIHVILRARRPFGCSGLGLLDSRRLVAEERIHLTGDELLASGGGLRRSRSARAERS